MVKQLAGDVDKLLAVADAAYIFVNADCETEPFAKAKLEKAVRFLHERG